MVMSSTITRLLLESPSPNLEYGSPSLFKHSLKMVYLLFMRHCFSPKRMLCKKRNHNYYSVKPGSYFECDIHMNTNLDVTNLQHIICISRLVLNSCERLAARNSHVTWHSHEIYPGLSPGLAVCVQI